MTHWRGASLALALGSAVDVSSCCMLGHQDYFSPVADSASRPDVEVRDSSIQVAPIALMLGRQPGAFIVRCGQSSRVRIESVPFSWDPYSFGPLLPVIPVLMGAGMALPLEIQLTALDGPLLLVPNEVRITTSPRGEEAAPIACNQGRLREKEQAIADLGMLFQIEEGKALSMQYPFRPHEIDAFEVCLRTIDPQDHSAVERRLRFQRSGSVFLGWVLIAPD
jgi:hypothetical protein